jgi:RNA polymerase sigma-70 factor (ECF subfamily)
MLEDQRLLWRLKRGDKEALRSIYEKYKDNMLTVATSLLHDAGSAEDVLHDVFVSFAMSVRKIELHSSLRKYLITSIINRVRDRFRTKKHHIVELDEVGPVSSDSESPERSAILSEESRLLAGALARLPLEQRETIVLHLKADMKFKQIAKMQGISISTVQGRYRYGLSKLRTILNGEMKK